MDKDEWSQLAFSLGLPTREIDTPTVEAKRFVQKMKQRKKDPNTRVNDLLSMLLHPIYKPHDKIDLKTDTPFWREAVPQEVTDKDVEQGWSMQLPTPRPAFTFGYRSDAFPRRYQDLQHGIVNKEKGEPCNLSQVSQPVPDIYWPFLVIESRPRAHANAMKSAKHACAGVAATCNNAIIILSNAAQRPNEYSTSPSLQWDTHQAGADVLPGSRWSNCLSEFAQLAGYLTSRDESCLFLQPRRRDRSTDARLPA